VRVLVAQMDNSQNLHLYCSTDPEFTEVNHIERVIEGDEAKLVQMRSYLDQQQKLTDQVARRGVGE
jgi:hypothetical protein